MLGSLSFQSGVADGDFHLDILHLSGSVVPPEDLQWLVRATVAFRQRRQDVTQVDHLVRWISFTNVHRLFVAAKERHGFRLRAPVTKGKNANVKIQNRYSSRNQRSPSIISLAVHLCFYLNVPT